MSSNNLDNLKPIISQDFESLSHIKCLDYLAFQARLANIRKFDDKIINILNAEIPTESFISKGLVNPTQKCKQLKSELHNYYDLRENAVRNCYNEYKNEVFKLKALVDSSKDPNMRSTLLDKSATLRYYHQELEIEKIIKLRSLKAVDERCKQYE